MLNRKLYHRVKKAFKEVEIRREGDPGQYKIYKDPKDRRWKADVSDFGETYNVCCFGCTDTRFRLNIPYSYGLRMRKDAKTIYFPFVWTCFNETHCHTKRFNRDKLYKKLIENNVALTLCDSTIKKTAKKITISKKFKKPKDIIPLHELPTEHPANQYLINRRFNPVKLSEICGFGYIPKDADVPLKSLRDRIYIPSKTADGVEIGGQARIIEEDQNSIASKYLSIPGSNLRDTFFNLDLHERCVEDKKGNIIIIVEGALDAIRVAPYAVGLMGSSLTTFKRNYLLDSNKTVIFALDSDLGTKNPIIPKKCKDLVSQIDSPERRAYYITLPEDKDPAEFRSVKEFMEFLRGNKINV